MMADSESTTLMALRLRVRRILRKSTTSSRLVVAVPPDSEVPCSESDLIHYGSSKLISLRKPHSDSH